MLQLSETQVKELEAFIQTIPTAYGLPLLQFLGKIAQEQNAQQVQEPQTEVKQD